MEYFTKSKYVRLRSHHNKYLIAGSDGESVKQRRDSKSVQARWEVEVVEGSNTRNKLIRLKSCFNKYLTATDDPFLLGWTGKKVQQTTQGDEANASTTQWEPVKEDFYVKMRTLVTGKYLRGNFSAPPWRNSVTVDVPERSSTQDWIMWVVEVWDDNMLVKNCKSLMQGGSSISSSSSLSSLNSMPIYSARYSSCSSIEGIEDAGEVDSTWSGDKSLSLALSTVSSTDSLALGYKSGMELFHNAKTVRMRSHHDKYLMADDEGEAVVQDRNGGSKRVRWTVEYIKSGEGVSLVRLMSCYGKYLTATDDEFLLGVTGKKVKQTMPRRLDSSIEWEPIRDGMQVKLKTRYGNFLRANGGLPPWRNSITHDVPSRSHTQDWILWEVDVLEVYPKEKEKVKEVVKEEEEKEKGKFERCESEVEPFTFQPPIRSESGESGASGVKNEGRVIYYNIVDDDGDIVDEGEGGRSLVFIGTGVQELTQTLEAETGLSDITVCTRSPLNGKVYPMKLALPPNHVKLHVYAVPASSKAAAELA